MTEATVCVANINRAGKRRRMTLGVVVLVATVVAAFWLQKGYVTAWSLLAIAPLGFGWLCVVQAAENT
jgi:hypothetical protein